MNRITSRIWALLFAVIALATLMLLAVSVNGLILAPGLPFPLNQLLPNVVSENVSSQTAQVVIATVRIFAIISWILLPLVVVFLILSKKARARLLRDLAIILPFVFVFYMMINIMMNNNVQNQSTALNRAGQVEQNIPKLPEFVPPPAWVTTAAVGIIAVLFALLVIGVILIFWRREQNKAQDALAIVRYEIQNALDAIEAGSDVREAIIKCYVQMITALKEYRNISRYQDMTPHEFEEYIEHFGLPHDPVHRLTLLFEKARYGALMPGVEDEREALESLSAIIRACQQPEVLPGAK